MKADLFHADGRTDRQTDRYDEANSLFSQFCELAEKRKVLQLIMSIRQDCHHTGHESVQPYGKSLVYVQFFVRHRYRAYWLKAETKTIGQPPG
jgi:hypothetical protein